MTTVNVLLIRWPWVRVPPDPPVISMTYEDLLTQDNEKKN